MKVVDESENRLGPNSIGEILMKTPVPILGYFGEPEKSREAFDDEGWLRTGDLGYFDDDHFLFLTGRTKEMLKYNNYQVQPSEIEELINSIDGVENSSVVGILNKSSGNDIIIAFVKRAPKSFISENEIIEFVHQRVIDAKKIRGGVHFVDSFPLNPSGKIKKNELKKLAEKMITGHIN